MRMLTGIILAIATLFVAGLKDAAGEEQLPTQYGRGAFSPDGRLLAVAEGGQTVRLYDPSTGKLVRALDRKEGRELKQLAWRPDGKVLATAGDDVVLHDPKTGAVISRLDLSAPQRLAWTPDGKALVGASHRGLQRWDADTGVIRKFTNKDVYIWSAALSPDGGQMATIGEHGEVRLWDLKTGENERAPVEYGRCQCYVDWNSRSGMLALSGHQGGRPVPGENIIRVWNSTSGAVVHDLAGPDKGAILAWNPDGTMLAVAHGWNSRWRSNAPPAKVTLWDAEAGKLLHTLQTDEQQVSFLAWTPDGTLLASGGPGHVYYLDADREVRKKTQITKVSFWSPETGMLLRSAGGDEKQAPDGRN